MKNKYISIWIVLSVLILGACSGLREQTVWVQYLSKEGIKFKRSSKRLSKNDITFFENYVHQYAPFCNWASDTIIMETMTSIVSKYFGCLALSTSSDSLIFSERMNYYSELTQEGFPSMDEYYSPSRTMNVPKEFVDERIAALKNIKYWQIDSIERKVSEQGHSELSCTLNRIIIKDNKITGVSTYYCCPLTFYY